MAHRKPLYAGNHFIKVDWFILKDATLEQPNARGAYDKVWSGDWHRACMSYSVQATFTEHLFTNLEAPWAPSCRGLKEVSLHKNDWLNYWPLVIEVNHQLLFPVWRSGGRAKSTKSLIKASFFWWPAPTWSYLAPTLTLLTVISLAVKWQ